jgi:hypothetical protein
VDNGADWGILYTEPQPTVTFDLDDCDQPLLTEDDLQDEEISLATKTFREIRTANVGFYLADTLSM